MRVLSNYEKAKFIKYKNLIYISAGILLFGGIITIEKVTMMII
ncbi:hypothetical protein ACFIJ5_01180 [Haloimpatiens sp. FM7330]